ncbi:MAG: cytidylate kinase [Chloroflexi bacterium]|nr:cytidylate kinase [Chloroflexota bacterium]|tara:strand:- start:1638 stop:2294 length:657 start_codon:yes stop_codon:yes gene_type:complete
MIITIDGPAGVGKTTVGKLTAEKLGMGFLDTGIMYRALTWFLINKNLEDDSIDKIKSHLENLNFDLNITNIDFTTVSINKINVTKLLNSPEVEKYVSKISSFKEVREIMVKKQREIVYDSSSVVVGRDIGTIVLPNARSKFYLTASAEERAKRRFSQNSEKVPYPKVLKELKERDNSDMSRKYSPLKVPQNALIIDTEKKNIHQVSDEIIEKINYESS